MKRFYYIADDVDELERIEGELTRRGISTEQVHVLSLADDSVARHHLHDVMSFMKKDILRSARLGAMAGLAVAALVLSAAWVAGLHQSAGGLPFLFLGIVLVGFCTWEGGLWGIQVPNSNFRRFEEALQAGRHVLFVDVDRGQDHLLGEVLNLHPDLVPAGTGTASPRWVVDVQQGMKRFVQWAP